MAQSTCHRSEHNDVAIAHAHTTTGPTTPPTHTHTPLKREAMAGTTICCTTTSNSTKLGSETYRAYLRQHAPLDQPSESPRVARPLAPGRHLVPQLVPHRHDASTDVVDGALYRRQQRHHPPVNDLPAGAAGEREWNLAASSRNACTGAETREQKESAGGSHVKRRDSGG